MAELHRSPRFCYMYVLTISRDLACLGACCPHQFYLCATSSFSFFMALGNSGLVAKPSHAVTRSTLMRNILYPTTVRPLSMQATNLASILGDCLVLRALASLCTTVSGVSDVSTALVLALTGVSFSLPLCKPGVTLYSTPTYYIFYLTFSMP
jgi:hypothetical protein